MIITKEQKALARENLEENIGSGLNCCESVFNALIRAGIVDLPEEMTCLASGMGGGTGLTGKTCGALVAAAMSIGAEYGRRDPIGDHAKLLKSVGGKADVKDPTQDYRYYMMRRFNRVVADFQEEIGTTQCQEIVDSCGGYKNKHRQNACENCMRTALKIAIRYLEMPQDEADKLPYGRNLFGWE